MTLLYLVRHGRAAASWEAARDPGLDATGRAQAEAAARRLDALVPERGRILTSPLARARETAAPLARCWEREAAVAPGVAEVPSPGLGLAERGAWLRSVLASRWSLLDPALHAWRDEALAVLRGCQGPTVIFTHAVLINAVVAAVTGEDRVLVFQPDHGSVTVLRLRADALELERLGEAAATEWR